MIDIKFLRENPEIVRKDLKKRDDKEKLGWVDEILKQDAEYRKLLREEQQLRHSRNEITQRINMLRKEGKDISTVVSEAKALPEKIKKADERIQKLQEEIKYKLMRLPNILHESVPVGKDDTGNKVVETVGKKPTFNFELQQHGEVAVKLGLANFEKAAEVSGNGFYYLMGDLAHLELALIQFTIDEITKKGYTLIQPPLMLRRKPYEGVTDLADFETMMYKIENEDAYLIATSEHAMGALYMGETFEEEKLPVKLCGVSPCFRKEIGSHGIDTKGLFRVHHFNKVEQFVFCKPKDSWKIHEELLSNAKQIFTKLKIPYRVVNICTGDIGLVASKKYDIEAWMPREKKYREVVSCSNCTTYQAVRLNIKMKKGQEKEFVHTLNSTAIATSRALRAIIENYQQKDGTIKIPNILVKYMNGKKIIK